MANIFNIIILVHMLTFATCQQTQFYPIIFIHGHSGNLNVENTWDYLIQRYLTQVDYYDFGKIWSQTSNDLQNNSLSPRTIFQFGFYRENPYQYFIQHSNIGLIPHQCGSVPYYCGVADSMRCSTSRMYSYADRLSITIINILRAIGTDKVDIVAHGMGGLIARAYMRWGDGKNTIRKLLLVGTPNLGISENAQIQIEKINNPQYNWQQYGEYIEMAKSEYFEGNSYTYWLNKDWYQFTTNYNISYATIRGDFNPWKTSLVDASGDGIIDAADVILDGAVFNGILHAAHYLHIDFPKDLIHRYGYEESITTSTYTALVITRWLIGDLVNYGKGEIISPILNDVRGNAGLQFSIRQGNPLVSIVQIYSNDNKWLSSYGLPINQGSYEPKILEDISPIMPSTTYQMRTTIYSMKNVLYNRLTSFTKENSTIKRKSPRVKLLKKPNKITNETISEFVMSGDSELRYAYLLDNGNLSEYSYTRNITLTFLRGGIHTIFIVYDSESIGHCEKPLEYTWLILDETISSTNTPITIPKIRKPILVDNFENYTVGRLRGQGPWKAASHDANCGPVVAIDPNRGKYASGSSCVWSQGVKREYNFTFDYSRNDSYLQFTGKITSGSGNNAGPGLHIYNSVDRQQTLGFGYVKCPYDCPNVHFQPHVVTGPGSKFYGDYLSPGRWYDFRLLIDWTYSKLGRLCLLYRVTGTSAWTKDSKLCYKDITTGHASIFNDIYVGLGGIYGRLAEMDDIIVYY